MTRRRCQPNKSERSFAKPKALPLAEATFSPTAYFLSLSGGGDNGASAAGLLIGWTARGDRPKFKLVTGVSTGALTAPFAFLGPEYDAALTEVYTNIRPSKVFGKRFLPVAALVEDALADTSPLFETISHYVDQAILAKIAAEYEKGRLLLIQTTDIDAGLPVLWNIGAIAASGHPGAAQAQPTLSVGSCSRPHPYQGRSHRCCSTSKSMANPIRKCMSMAARSARRFLFRPFST